MQHNNIIIGIEGLVGSGKTSLSKDLLNYIPNSIIIHGGNIYRAIVNSMLKSGIELKKMIKDMKNTDIMNVIKNLGLEIKLENRETVVYLNGKRADNQELQSEKTSIAVSAVSNVADNKNLYEFGKRLIDSFAQKYNVILSSRDIMKMYPDTTYHFFIVADLEERINRKYIQYKGNLSKEEIKQMIEKRDELQKKSGYYKIYDNTYVIDVTNCKTSKQASQKLLQHIKIRAVV